LRLAGAAPVSRPLVRSEAIRPLLVPGLRAGLLPKGRTGPQRECSGEEQDLCQKVF